MNTPLAILENKDKQYIPNSAEADNNKVCRSIILDFLKKKNVKKAI